MKVLELGNYIVPAYAGMILAEQSFEVVKWTNGKDPILGLNQGEDLWAWINEGKTLVNKSLENLPYLEEWPDLVIDNFRPSILQRAGIDPSKLAADHNLIWVSMRADYGERSFDLISQCRSWMEYAPWVPFYVGDTSAGLWLAFKALAMSARGQSGHYVLGQASCLQKLVEGELVLDPPRDGRSIPWDRESYTFKDGRAVIEYKGHLYTEPIRDRQWKLVHLWHTNGRIKI